MTAATIGLGELGLRAVPRLVGGAVANHAYGGYHAQPGGIYRRDANLGYALKPDFAQSLYWNGHWWKHETNADGYRGAAVDAADVVFLGDSMIYGHGVENDQTVPSQFQAITGRTVANLGQQGTCLVQMESRLRHLGPKLRPRVVVVCSHTNDIREASDWYPEEELARYVAAPAAEACDILARPTFRPRPAWRIDEHVWNAHVAPHLRFTRAVGALTRISGQGRVQRREFGSADGVFVPPAGVVAMPFAPWDSTDGAERLGWQVHDRALARINEVCKQTGARLVLIDLGYPHAFSRAIADAAKRLGATYVPAGEAALRRAQAGEETYLANDGHWTAHGSRVVAEEIATALKP